MSADDAAQHFVLREAYPARHQQLVAHITSLWSGPRCEMMECLSCGLNFAHPFVAGDAKFYNLAYPHSDYPEERWEFSLTVDALAKLITVGKRGIEIGSGFGYFLNCISPRFFPQEDLIAIEYSDAAGRCLANAGFQVSKHDIRSDAFGGRVSAFDFVFMFQVLEHMDRLDVLAERLRLVTSPGAHIFVAVPNPERIRFNERTASLLDMPPNHISLWTGAALEKFAARLGCELVDCQVEPMTWLKLIQQDLVYSYMRRAQTYGSLPNRVRSRPRSEFRRICEAVLALSGIPSRIPCWVSARKSSGKLGGSIWAQLRRL